MTATALEPLSAEHAELLSTLEKHRSFLRFTVQGLTDEQAGQCTTSSELCVGGLVKHVTATERQWVRFIQEGPSAMDFSGDPDAIASYADQFRMLPEDTVESVLAAYDDVAAQTAEIVGAISDLNVGHPLPEAPWFEPGATWSARRVVLHLIAETSQHAGHADIIRECLDGQRTMG